MMNMIAFENDVLENVKYDNKVKTSEKKVKDKFFTILHQNLCH